MNTTEPATLPDPLKRRLESKWEAYTLAAQQAGLAHPPDAKWIQSMRWAFVFSDFIADSCTRQPDLVEDLYTSGDLNRTYSPDTYPRKLAAASPNMDSDAAQMSALRTFRKREMVRIAWRDLTRQANLDQTLADLTRLADACVQHALSYL